ncbi:phage portal protein [Domibacillus antri]|uniref:Phage portal protein n=1 Tax=Domibacillus antri TaxID=1714264 RepID=A0A1Q8Q3C5_9BACI|nr:phage portal protein [Domibacillus antri]OLN21853.1 phage portal protein [Domibacillus antri]
MNQEVGSIMASFHSVFPVKVYDEKMPEDFVVPSMYFPPPFSFDGPDTVSTFMKTFSLSVKLFHQSSHQASDEAERIADTIRAKRHLVPLLNADGTATTEFIRINRIDTRVTGEVATIIVTWDSRYYYERETFKPLTNITIISGVK